MTEPIMLYPGIALRCFPDHRFKHGCLSVQLVRPMCQEEVALNALLPAVLLRGCRKYPDLRSITLRLDELYGAGVGMLVRRVGDWQITGLYFSFIEDRFAMAGDQILPAVTELLQQLMMEPVVVDGGMHPEFVSGEIKNLVATIESQLNDKRSYAMDQMLRLLCAEDSYGIPRLGEVEQVARITPQALYGHYLRILRESRIDLCYVGSAQPEQLAQLLKPVFSHLDRDYVNLPAQTPLSAAASGDHVQTMQISQGKLCMGFVTPITIRSGDFAAMQVCNMIFGGGVTSKLFGHIRETLNLCYAIGSGYIGTKGIVTVSAGIDNHLSQQVQQQILAQWEACCSGEITQQELIAAKQALRSGLLATEDSPGAMENYYAVAALSGLSMTPAQYIEAVEQVTVERVAAAAKTMQLKTVYFLKGVTE